LDSCWPISIFNIFSLQHWKKLTRICEKVTWYDDEIVPKLFGLDLDLSDPTHLSKVVNRHKYLLKSDTPEGAAYQQWILNIRPEIRDCQERLSEPEFEWY